MLRCAFVWQKSIYDNHFKCNQCGAKLFNVKKNEPTKYLCIDANAEGYEDEHLCFCGRCQNLVAKYEEIEIDEDEDDGNILMGSYSEWIEKKAVDLQKEMQKRTAEHYEKKYEQKIKDLEYKVKTKDDLIGTLKRANETYQNARAEDVRKLQKELEHANKQIEKLQMRISELEDKK